jgi:hypothetical protein
MSVSEFVPNFRLLNMRWVHGDNFIVRFTQQDDTSKAFEVTELATIKAEKELDVTKDNRIVRRRRHECLEKEASPFRAFVDLDCRKRSLGIQNPKDIHAHAKIHVKIEPSRFPEGCKVREERERE